MNKALKIARGDFFACLDADSFVHPLTLRKMLALYYKENDPELAIVTPAMKVAEPKNLLQKVQWLEYLVIILIARVTSRMDSLYVAPGPFSLYRTEIIRKLGGFDEQNITEDQEIAYRIQLHHYKIKHCFDGYVYTTAPDEMKAFYLQRRRWYLGSIMCLYQYKSLVANKRYGDFGMMQMTKSTVGFILSVVGVLIVAYLLLLPFFTELKNLFLVHFNILPYLMNYEFKITFLNFLQADFRKGFIILFLFTIGAYLFQQAHRNANEKMTRFGIIPLIPYFAYYYLIKSIILLLSMIEFSRGKKVRW
jgi:cellulose synthase/poly-beta-1,6-N-acetylglucosamine synthase-like glycosyltransferase